MDLKTILTNILEVLYRLSHKCQHIWGSTINCKKQKRQQ